MKTQNRRLRLPAEWDLHDATWLAWPHQKEDWPGYFEPSFYVLAEFIRLLHKVESVYLICQNLDARRHARRFLQDHGVDVRCCHFLILETDRGWLRDSAPTAIFADRKMRWISWRFNAWGGCYENFQLDQRIPSAIARATKLPLEEACWPDGTPVVLEAGSFDTNGEGVLLTTEECLVGGAHPRNPGRTKKEYEEMFSRVLGIKKVIWLGQGFQLDQTQGHIDNVARFLGPRTILIGMARSTTDPNFSTCQDNRERLEAAKEFLPKLDIVPLVMPAPVIIKRERVPATYLNFYIANQRIIVPTFNDPNDNVALRLIKEASSSHGREVVGLHCRELVWGYGGPHCLAQQQPF